MLEDTNQCKDQRFLGRGNAFYHDGTTSTTPEIMLSVVSVAPSCFNIPSRRGMTADSTRVGCERP
jgi:hypothetical protein